MPPKKTQSNANERKVLSLQCGASFDYVLSLGLEGLHLLAPHPHLIRTGNMQFHRAHPAKPLDLWDGVGYGGGRGGGGYQILL
mgnify:CR=1 FL=1